MSSPSQLPDPPTPVLPAHATLKTMLALHTCTRNCWGRADTAANCCRLDDRDYVQGPVNDTETVLAYLSAESGRAVPYDEVFVEMEEGRALFPDRLSWQNSANFPALRPVSDKAGGYPCRFLAGNGLCRIYDGRPAMCRTYRCKHLTSVLEQV
jgi:Fe-S-cluster containining protein